MHETQVRWLLSLPLVLLVSSLGAQTDLHTVSGIVADPQGLAVQNATVRVFAPNRVLLAETQTNSSGEFTLSALPSTEAANWTRATLRVALRPTTRTPVFGGSPAAAGSGWKSSPRCPGPKRV